MIQYVTSTRFHTLDFAHIKKMTMINSCSAIFWIISFEFILQGLAALCCIIYKYELSNTHYKIILSKYLNIIRAFKVIIYNCEIVKKWFGLQPNVSSEGWTVTGIWTHDLSISNILAVGGWVSCSLVQWLELSLLATLNFKLLFDLPPECPVTHEGAQWGPSSCSRQS